MKNTVILFCCHFWSEEIENEFFRLKECCDKEFDVVLSYDCTRTPAPFPGDDSRHLFTLDRIKKMGYNFKTDEGIWHHVEYPIIDYYLQKPQYDFYWRIEYDVKFGGDWGLFFRHFADNKADLLGTYIKTYKEDPEWRWWRAMNCEINRNDLRGMFFAVTRFSREALDLLQRKYQSGMSGYCEVVVPTLLNMGNMKIEDIGKNYYDSFTFNCNAFVIQKKGKLYHAGRRKPLKVIAKVLKGRRKYP